jgi:hypothetical protein
MSDLKKNLKNHYESKTLTKSQLSKLEQLQNKKRIPITKWQYALAASLVFICIFLIYPKRNTLESIANEVIYNHKKALPSEFIVDSISELNTRLIKLEFETKDSTQLANYEVLGARYCSIQGQTAAQIKVRKNTSISTLYQSDFIRVDKSKLPYVYTDKNTSVRIWVENNLLHALATDIN